MIGQQVVAIHQPNFLPWLGYFNKIARSDIFVLLDHVQFPKTGGCWTNRVKVIVGGVSSWMTVPIQRNYQGVQSINNICIDNSKPWRKKMCKAFETNYRKCAYFSSTIDLLAEIFSYKGNNIAEFNTRGLKKISEHIGWNDRMFIISSNLKCYEDGTDLLVSISKAVGATIYLAGGGAGDYQDDTVFKKNGVTVAYQNYKHPLYPQSRSKQFHPGLSIIDALFEIGPAETVRLLDNNLL